MFQEHNSHFNQLLADHSVQNNDLLLTPAWAHCESSRCGRSPAQDKISNLRCCTFLALKAAAQRSCCLQTNTRHLPTSLHCAAAYPHTRDVQFRRSARSSASCSTAVPWCGRSHSQEHRLKTSSENSARVHRSSVQARSQIQGVLRGSPCCIRLKHMELLLNLCRWICVLSSGMAGQHRHSCA